MASIKLKAIKIAILFYSLPRSNDKSVVKNIRSTPFIPIEL